MHQNELLLSNPLLVCFDLWTDLIPAALFGAAVSAAALLWWHQRSIRAVREEYELKTASLFEHQKNLEESLLEREQSATELKNQLQEQLLNNIPAEEVEVRDTPHLNSDSKKPEIIFYMPQPNRNGRFLESGRHSDEEKAIYAFRPHADNPSLASFEFVARDVYLQVALGNEPTWINAACERNNLPGAHTSQVKTLSPGQAVLHGDEWEITRKAHITYL